MRYPTTLRIAVELVKFKKGKFHINHPLAACEWVVREQGKRFKATIDVGSGEGAPEDYGDVHLGEDYYVLQDAVCSRCMGNMMRAVKYAFKYNTQSLRLLLQE